VGECRAIGMVHKKAPIAGTGWGCFQCGLPNDGAMAIACDACVESGLTSTQNPREVCAGKPGESALRVMYNELGESFDHDESKHPELREQTPLPTDTRLIAIPVMRKDAEECDAWLQSQLVKDGVVKDIKDYTGVERMLANVLGALHANYEPGVCRVCHCTDVNSCPGGCCWVNDDATLCSECARQL